LQLSGTEGEGVGQKGAPAEELGQRLQSASRQPNPASRSNWRAASEARSAVQDQINEVQDALGNPDVYSAADLEFTKSKK
jgi:hypothetical protein